MRILLATITALLALAAAGSAASSPDHPLAGTHYRDSIADLGYRLYFGDSTLDPQPTRARLLIAEASHLGDPRADNNLAYILLNGDSAVRDPQRAFTLFRRAADAGLPTAMAQLADLYRTGTATEPDSATASSLYLKAAARGLRDAETKLIAMNRPAWTLTRPDSLLSLARTYYPRIAPTAAVEMLRIAAQCPDSLTAPDGVPVCATAYAILGDATARGIGKPYDYTESLRLFFIAATLGDPSAQFIIAETLEITPDALIPVAGNTDDDRTNARYWYDQAAKFNIDNAQKAYKRLLPTVRQPF